MSPLVSLLALGLLLPPAAAAENVIVVEVFAPQSSGYDDRLLATLSYISSGFEALCDFSSLPNLQRYRCAGEALSLEQQIELAKGLREIWGSTRFEISQAERDPLGELIERLEKTPPPSAPAPTPAPKSALKTGPALAELTRGAPPTPQAAAPPPTASKLPVEDIDLRRLLTRRDGRWERVNACTLYSKEVCAGYERAHGRRIDLETFYLVKAIISRESSFNPDLETKEPDGRYSYGLMQIVYETAQGIGFTGGAKELLRPSEGVYWGIKYFLQRLTLAERLRGSDRRFARLPKAQVALAGYNAGTPRFRRDGKLVSTKDYDVRVHARAKMLRAACGFTSPEAACAAR